MAKYRVRGPDGAVHVFEGPDGAAPADIEAAAAQQFGASSAPPAAAPATQPEERGMLANIAAGLASGVADLGDTIINAGTRLAPARPEGMLFDRLPSKDQALQQNAERNASLEQFNTDHGDSTAFEVGRVGGNVLATAPVGGVIGAGVKMLSAAPIVQALGNAVASGGLRTGAGLNGASNLAARAVGGAVAGGATTALVDPEHAAQGAMLGAALPVVVKGVGAAANAIGGRAGLAASQAAAGPSQKMLTARAGAAEGYVVPPVDLEPGIVSQLVSGLSGKIKTSQAASQRNQVVTDAMARRALGLSPTDELTPEVLQAVRTRAGDAYGTLRNAGTVQADQVFLDRLTQIGSVSQGAARSFPGLKQNGVEDLIAAVRQPQFDAGDAIDATKVLREAADQAFRGGDATKGRAAKAAATALEDQIERHLTAAGDAEAVTAFRNARQQIAKTYSVQSALNPSTGSVSAPKLAKDLERGKPLSAELRKIAEFSTAFPRATQALKEAPGAVSPLDWLFSGGTAMGVGGPAGAAMLLGRPAARAALLSGPVQAAALRESVPNPAITSALAKALEASYRGAPVGLLANPAGSP